MGVASRLDLPDDWLNDAAKGYLVGLTIGEVLYESPNLLVRAASLPQLLAMKLAAWRDEIDRGDARTLLTHMSGSQSEIWTAIQPFLTAHNADKVSYAFEDLWESVHGHP
jgi:predicted nucleotidyltransferase